MIDAGATGSAASSATDPPTGGFGDGSTPPDLPQPRRPADLSDLGHLVAWRDEEMDRFFGAFSALLDAPSVSYSHKWEEGDVVIIDNLAVAHKAAPGAHTLDSGLRILHRTTVLSQRAHDPPASLRMPFQMPTDRPCPFQAGATWCEGYVGFRWGSWEARAIPH